MVSGQRVKQARELKGWTQFELARKIGIHQSAIAQIEGGRTTPSETVLEGIVLQTGFCPSFFRSPPTIEFPLGTLLFRARASMTAKERAEAHQYGFSVFELFSALNRHFLPTPLALPRIDDTPVAAAQITRTLMGLSPDTPIENLVRTIEKSGGLIFALPRDLKKRDAYSVWARTDNLHPIIVICGYVSGDRLRFSVAHELGHLVLHSALKGNIPGIEVEADAYAAELLLPEVAMRREIIKPVTLTTLADLKPRWKVSIQALVRRAYTLNIISQRQYKYLMQQISQHGWRLKEPIEIPFEKPRALSQMAEMMYGKPINYKKLASDINFSVRLCKELLSPYAGVMNNSAHSNKPTDEPVKIYKFQKED